MPDQTLTMTDAIQRWLSDQLADIDSVRSAKIVSNEQDRLIIIAMPMIFLVLFYGAWSLSKRYSFVRMAFLAFSVVMLAATAGKTSLLAKQNLPALKKNLGGDIFYGYTPDWQNYLAASRFCADSLPPGSRVLARKPNMSFIYTQGKTFIGQYVVTSTDADTVLAGWKKLGIEYIMLADLRLDPSRKDGKVINTIHRMLHPVDEKYHNKLQVIKVFGSDENTAVVKINY